jgi:glycosyltransferase involved in cell wall biosynthesis
VHSSDKQCDKLQSVVQMTFSGRFGGRENVAFSLAKILSEIIPNSRLYLILETRVEEKDQNELLARLDGYGVQYRIFHISSRFSKQVLRELVDALRSDSAQIVHCHCYKSATYMSLARYLYNLKFKIAFTLHGLQIPLSPNSLFIHTMNYASLLFVDSIIGCSSEIVQRYRNFPPLRNKIAVIQNCLLADKSPSVGPKDRTAIKKQLADEYQLDSSALWIGNVGRLTKQKNIPLFLHAIARLKIERPGGQNIQFLIAGDGELHKELTSLAKKLGIDDVVVFMGFVSNMDKLYKALDVLALTSDWEGTPMCILEGMKHGLPIIASKVGGTVDLLEHERSGLFFQKGNISEFVWAVMALADNPDTRKRLGENAFERVCDDFTPTVWRDRHLQLYNDLTWVRNTLQN